VNTSKNLQVTWDERFCWGDIIFSGGILLPEVPYGEGSPETFISRSEELIIAIEVFG
jgi:hypothetical protein